MGMDLDFYHKHNGEIEGHLWLRNTPEIDQMVRDAVVVDGSSAIEGDDIGLTVCAIISLLRACERRLTRDGFSAYYFFDAILNDTDELEEYEEEWAILRLYIFLRTQEWALGDDHSEFIYRRSV